MKRNVKELWQSTKTITVSQTRKTEFKTIQSAIDSVPSGNSQWIHIRITPGVYKEHILIPMDKPCIYLERAGRKSTSVEWGDPLTRNATLNVKANNTVAKGITFTNTHNNPVIMEKTRITQAKAARIHADKCAFLDCAFLGVQDTLYDSYGRHYYHNCYIQGGIDFIYGSGQSIFEASTINFSMGNSGVKINGVFTAQERESPDDPSGFVFKNCNITGSGGKAILGRSFTAYARVIIVNSFLSDVVSPEGWNARSFVGHEETIMFVEEGNRGPGANKSKRVQWIKDLRGAALDHFLNITYIDEEGWIAKLPTKIFI
ncbi:probable pectinesterase 29 [Abrus precatorius]|uniref:pectinesterase n=1 Tax=Abrus precatorius TaxID=3816 RepID=A0A8B8LM47_ABRPR|nr:probable pectinesterase 29 [Abrus precatorius]